MNDHRRPRAVFAGLLTGVALLAAACSDGADSHPPVQPPTTTSSVATELTGPQAGDHAAEIAEYAIAARVALSSRTGVVFGLSDIVTGADTPRGWRVQNQRGSPSGQGAEVGNQQAEIVCAGRGEVDVSITVRKGPGNEGSVTPVPTACSAQGSASQTMFQVGTAGKGFDVDEVPAEGAVAVLGWVVV